MKNPLNRLYILAIAAGVLLISMFVGLQVSAHGWESLVQQPDGSGGILYAIGFWTVSGILAGLILGKMDAVVIIGNAERWTKATALDQLIVTLSCIQLRNGTVIQQQIANLISGPLAVGIVYLSCYMIYAVTGITMFCDYPGSLVMVILFATLWKLVENCFRDFLVRRHFAADAI